MLLTIYGIAILIIIYYIFFPHRSAFTALGWKSLSSCCFLFLAFFVNLQYQKATNTFASYMLAGFTLGACGDVLLALPACYPKKEKSFFLLGLLSFLAGHLCYIAALYHTAGMETLLLCLLSVLGGVWMILKLGKMGVQFQEMKLPAMCYAIVILFFTLQCYTYALSDSHVFGYAVMLGASLFSLSDFILAFILFGNKDTHVMTCANLTTYYAAQLLLTLTLLAG